MFVSQLQPLLMSGKKQPSYPFSKGVASTSAAAKSVGGPRGPMPPSAAPPSARRDYPAANPNASANASTANLLTPGTGASTRNQSSTTLNSQVRTRWLEHDDLTANLKPCSLLDPSLLQYLIKCVSLLLTAYSRC